MGDAKVSRSVAAGATFCSFFPTPRRFVSPFSSLFARLPHSRPFAILSCRLRTRRCVVGATASRHFVENEPNQVYVPRSSWTRRPTDRVDFSRGSHVVRFVELFSFLFVLYYVEFVRESSITDR